ncbi:MAG: PhoH family protein [Advenella sp.]|jgi:PhoH-like ATPase|uniref:PhoH family protein n=1 Tax=unclassified Advenella TaxID=2685285 RepID=UPI00145E968D|nr:MULTISPECIES: PhoH family protein [unclassified Advenella]MDD3756572.1 PhoH family protein [Advenella sp.]NLN68432.1 PhoH family protein [Alcaligenaceae bacterium]
MPLPKLPTKPADTIDINTIATPKPRATATAARARPKASATKATAAATEVVADVAQAAKTSRPATTTAAGKTATKSVSESVESKQAAPGTTKTTATKNQATKKTTRKTTNTATTETKKLFVLDTNVLLHDPSSLFRFQEHDIFLPMMTLEELDHHKKGMTEVARNARQVSRSLDALAAETDDILHGMRLDVLGNKDATGLLLFQTSNMESDLGISLPTGKADNMILSVVQTLQKQHPKRQVILVSKDINMRLKARALGMEAEDYLNDHSLEDSDLLYDGIMQLPANFWSRHGKDVESWMQGGTTYYKIKGPLCPEFIINEFVYLEGDTPLYAQVKEVSGKTAVLATLRDYTHKKNNVWGVTARNREQNFALNLLMNPDCDFVSLLGQAGTGKTLLALASGLTQVLETKRYSEIIMTRVTVPVGEDIGFLPGTEEEKMQPWMGALEDNLEFLNSGIHTEAGDWDRSASKEFIKSHIKVKSLNFMRGRTFLNKFLIIDEAQNLTPKQMKTLITRAGPGTKIVCLGNIAQIDTPYLTEGSSGLTYVVDRFKGWSHSGHVTLQKGERSRLADYASDAL